MPGSTQLIPWQINPGIQKDLTVFNSLSYLDGEWVRFYGNLPRKMGGYQFMGNGSQYTTRSLFSLTIEGAVCFLLGRENGVFLSKLIGETLSGEIAKFPPSFVSRSESYWQFEIVKTYDPIQAKIQSYVVAYFGNLNSYDFTLNEIYLIKIEDLLNPAIYFEPFSNTAGGPPAVNGGVLVVEPYLCVYGDFWIWSKNDNPLDFSDTNNITTAASKPIIKALTTRGGGTPNVLAWTNTSLHRGSISFSGSNNVFVFEEIQDNISILSPNCIVEYNGLFFWIGYNSFYVYSGIVETLNNETNREFFFSNLNYAYANKIWGFANRQYDEIVFFFPKGDATENNHAIIYNVKTKIWYDTPWARSSGTFFEGIPNPVLADSFALDQTTNTKPIWLHEVDTDVSLNSTTKLAIRSSFQTKFFSYFELAQENKTLIVKSIIPDFIQKGQLLWEVYGKQYPQSEPLLLSSFLSEPDQAKINMWFNKYMLSFKVISNEIGGYYQMGRMTMEIQPGDSQH